MIIRSPDFGKCKVCIDSGLGADVVGVNNDAVKNYGMSLIGESIGVPALPALNTVFSIAKEAKSAAANVCAAKQKVAGLLVQGLMQTLAASSGMPFFMLDVNVPGLLACDEGRAQIASALSGCLEALRGGIFDLFIGIGEIDPNGQQSADLVTFKLPPGSALFNTTDSGIKVSGSGAQRGISITSPEASDRRKRFAGHITDGLSIGLSLDQAVLVGREKLSEQEKVNYAVAHGIDPQTVATQFYKNSPYNPSDYLSKPGSVTNAMSDAGLAFVRDNAGGVNLSNDQLSAAQSQAYVTPGQYAGEAETIMLVRACLMSLVRDIAKATDPANYELYANPDFKAGDVEGILGLFSSKLAGWIFAGSGLLALLYMRKKANQ